MKILATFLLAFIYLTPAHAEQLRADAFGIFDPSTDPARAAWSGAVSPIGSTNDAEGQPVYVAPEDPETILVYFGQKSLEQGVGSAQMAALLLDRHGNLAKDGTKVVLRASDGAVAASTRNGVATRPVPAGEVVGEHHAWAQAIVDGYPRQSPRVIYRVLPPMTKQKAELNKPTEALTSEVVASLHAELSDQIEDANSVDGMSALIVLDHEHGGYSLIPSLWSGGALQARLLTRDIEGTAKARLHMPYSVSSQVPVVISPNKYRGPLRVRATAFTDIAATRLRLGPLTTQAGHLMHDGSLAQVSIIDAAGREFEARAWTLDGFAELTVPTDALPLALSVASPSGKQFQVVDSVEVVQ